jgi:hypothetical protein
MEMKSAGSFYRRLVSCTNVPLAGLLALLQRTPVVQVAAVAEDYVLASPVGTVLRSAAAVAASLGAIHGMAGATALVAADMSGPVSSPFQATVGTPIPTIAFTITGTTNGQTAPGSWTVGGSIPPGLSFDGLTTTGDDKNALTSALTGTPTKAGNYTMDLTGYEFANTKAGNASTTTSSTFSFTVDVAAGSGGGGGSNSPIYSVNKNALYIQTTATGAVADPKWPYVFGVQSPTATTLDLPNSTTKSVPADSMNGDFEINDLFATKSAMDATFPDGTYDLTGTGIPTLSFPLATDGYPSAVPSIMSSTNATWSGGVVMIDPTKASTINFSNFTAFATGGVGGFMQFEIDDQLKGAKSLKQAAISVSNSLGITQQSSPFTSYAIPSGTLNPSDIFQAQLQFTTALKFDDTTVSGSGVIGMFQNVLIFYIVTPPAGTTTQQPVLATDISNQAGFVGQSTTFSPSVTVGGSPISGTYLVDWYMNGNQISIDGTKYVGNGTSLTINNLTTADAGTYAAKFINFGGLVTTASATLTVSTQPAPTFPAQPMSQSMNVGSTVVFTAPASGASSYQWEFNGVPLANSQGGGQGDIITGGTGPQLVISNASAASDGSYTVVATNSAGFATSNAATLTVAPSSSPGSVSSISSRAFVGSGNNILIGGFYIVGNTSRTVLIQAIGPALAASPYSVAGTLQKPELSIHENTANGDVTLYSNTGWGSSPVLLAAAATVYAFPTLQPGSADSELVLTLPPGGYTAEVSGADGGTGVALCGIYQLP